jgi:phage baseplate assembly protein W
MPVYTSKFRGYSSVGTSFLSPTRYDLDLARQDLLNHFNTRKGERIMLPEFGSIVWDMLFEPLDEKTIRLIDEDVRRIIKNDPRWALQSVTITEGPNALNIEVIVTYLPSDETVTLPLTYDKGTNTV